MTDRIHTHVTKNRSTTHTDLGAIQEICALSTGVTSDDFCVGILFKGADRQQIRDFETLEARNLFIEQWKAFIARQEATCPS